MTDAENKKQQLEDVRNELDAMDKCFSILCKLKPEQIGRVLTWLSGQFTALPTGAVQEAIRRMLERDPVMPGGGTKYGGMPVREYPAWPTYFGPEPHEQDKDIR